MKLNLTILIPTYNRPKELSRLLAFLDREGNPYPVRILDGSNLQAQSENAKVTGQYAFAIHDRCEPGLHLGVRCAAGLAKVETEYIVFCADDDFVFPAALRQCTEFLSAHSDYSVVLGRVLALNYLKHKPIFRHGLYFEDHLGAIGYMAHSRFLQRALYYFAYTALGSTPLFYGVKKTSLARESFSHVTSEMKYSGVELILNALALVRGKIMVLDVPFGLRDYSSETTRDAEREDPETYLSQHDLDLVRRLLIHELPRVEPASEEIISNLVELFITHGAPSGWMPPRKPAREPAWIRRIKLGATIIESIVAPRLTAQKMASQTGQCGR